MHGCSLALTACRCACGCACCPVGVLSWLSHGTSSMLACMLPPVALAALQSGFRLPEFYTLAMVRHHLPPALPPPLAAEEGVHAVAVTGGMMHQVWGLRVGSHPTAAHLRVLYQATAALVALGLAAWIVIVR